MRRYIEKMTGLSRAQVTRLIAGYTASGRVQVTVYRRRRFTQRYTRADIELLAIVDEAHERLNDHRPCAQPDVRIDEKGRKRVRYMR